MMVRHMSPPPPKIACVTNPGFGRTQAVISGLVFSCTCELAGAHPLESRFIPNDGQL